MFMDEKIPKYTLRETVDNLGEAFPLKSKRSGEINHYWRCGYMVQQGALSLARIEAANIASMKRHFPSQGLGATSSLIILLIQQIWSIIPDNKL